MLKVSAWAADTLGMERRTNPSLGHYLAIGRAVTTPHGAGSVEDVQQYAEFAHVCVMLDAGRRVVVLYEDVTY